MLSPNWKVLQFKVCSRRLRVFCYNQNSESTMLSIWHSNWLKCALFYVKNLTFGQSQVVLFSIFMLAHCQGSFFTMQRNTFDSNLPSSVACYRYATEPSDIGNSENLIEGWDIVEHLTLPPPPSQTEDVEHWTRAMFIDATKKWSGASTASYCCKLSFMVVGEIGLRVCRVNLLLVHIQCFNFHPIL